MKNTTTAQPANKPLKESLSETKLKKEKPKSLLNGKALRKSQHRLLKQTKE